MNELEINKSIFENIKHIDERGYEFWYARELGKVLKYSEYRKFSPIIRKSIVSCKNSNQNINDHFVQVDVMVSVGSMAKRKLSDYRLSRYGCYLAV